MRQRNLRELAKARRELARLELQEQQFAMAVNKRERGKPGRPGKLSQDIVLDAARATEPPMSAGDVHATLAERGYDVTVNAVRNHLNRLVIDGELERDKDGYMLAAPVFVPNEFAASAADDDIPF